MRDAAQPDALPVGLTPSAAETFRDVVDEYRDGLCAALRRRRRCCPDLTSDDVFQARVIAAEAMCGKAHARHAGSVPALGPGLVLIGSVGVSAMHAYLHSSAQVAALVAFVLVGLVGVGLAWRGGHRVDPPHETAG